jgi:transposase InsO family protein
VSPGKEHVEPHAGGPPRWWTLYADLHHVRGRPPRVSRKTFYKWVGRFDASDPTSLEDRSRRPHRFPNQAAADVEDEIVRLRKELLDAGLDHGATTIVWHLGRNSLWKGRVPSVSTVHAVLVRRGQVVPQPRKRPKCSYRRFEAGAPNELWQIDAMDWVIATGLCRIFNIVDDHSRVAIRSRAVAEATTQQAWTTFGQGAAVWGLPAGTLSDNGLCFSGKLRGFEVAFEANLRDAGVRPITGRPFHPQTTGKVERFQQTLKKWLCRQPLARNLAELQAQLDRFCDLYNHHRPHQGIGRQVPATRWHATPAAGPAAEPLAHPDWPSRTHHSTVAVNGNVQAGRYTIHIGSEYATKQATVIIDHRHANVFVDHQLVRHLELNLARRYQPSHRPRHRRPTTT